MNDRLYFLSELSAECQQRRGKSDLHYYVCMYVICFFLCCCLCVNNCCYISSVSCGISSFVYVQFLILNRVVEHFTDGDTPASVLKELIDIANTIFG